MTVPLDTIFDWEECDQAIATGLVTRRQLGGTEISVLNYSASCAWKNIWTPVTRACRGLVVEGWGRNARVLARPFPKFFNLGVEPPGTGPMVGSAKWDGSLGVLYEAPDGWRITTRGDPNSWQSAAATALYRERYAQTPSPGQTWLFEIILPENRIVVDYGAMTDLVGLACIDIATGRDLGVPQWDGPVAQRLPLDQDAIDKLIRDNPPNQEGYVVLWPECDPQVRAKVKLAHYVTLHRLLFATTTKGLWEALKSGVDPASEIAAICGGAEPAFVEWVQHETDTMRQAHAEVLAATQRALDALTDEQREERRLVAKHIYATTDFPTVAFALFNGRLERAEEAAWEAVRPTYTRPFRHADPTDA